MYLLFFVEKLFQVSRQSSFHDIWLFKTLQQFLALCVSVKKTSTKHHPYMGNYKYLLLFRKNHKRGESLSNRDHAL